MTPENFRWLVRNIDSSILFWFTIYCFWVDTPQMKWWLLAVFILDTFGVVELNKKMGLPEHKKDD